jgi:two-component system, cell cycle sensor histidine kinase and response regulator CckA
MHRAGRGVVIRRDVYRNRMSPISPTRSGADERSPRESPLLRLARSWNAGRLSTGAVGAVSGVSVLLLALLLDDTAVAAAAIAGIALGAAASNFLRRRPARPATDELARLPVAALDARASNLALLHVNPPLEQLLGVARDAAATIDDLWAERLHELDRTRVLDEWSAWVAGSHREAFRSDYRLLAADGCTVFVEDVTIHIPAEDGRPETFRRHLLDVSRQRQLEDQLLQAQRLELLGKLAAGVAHDFNNLLAVISGYAARLTTPLPRGAQEESGIAITAAADRGASLVRQLLAFSRPQPASSRIVDLNDLVREFAPMLQRVIGEDVELELRLDSHRLPVDVHPVQIDQVLMNIAVNARDAMPQGGSLAIGTWKLDGSAIVTVSDTGLGMDATTQERIFEPFFSTKEPTRGSGLGLATAHSIVQQTGGSITVSSRPGEGTTFTVNLPLAAADATSSDDVVIESVAPDGGPETVLVVEDEPSLRELERLMLEDAGYEVLTAATAAEALLVAADNVIDLLVVDVVLPGMSGPQLVEELRARGCDLPTVFISGYGADEVSSRGISGARTAVLEKPFHPELLLRRVRDVLDAATHVGPRADSLQE